MTLPDGEVITREFKAGEVLWPDAPTPVEESIVQTDTRVIIFEPEESQPELANGQ